MRAKRATTESNPQPRGDSTVDFVVSFLFYIAAFGAGSLVTWLVAKAIRKPDVPSAELVEPEPEEVLQ